MNGCRRHSHLLRVLPLTLLLLAVCDTAGFSQAAGRRFTVAPKPAWLADFHTTSEQQARSDTLAAGILYLSVDDQLNLATDESYCMREFQVLNDAGLDDASNLSFDFDPAFQKLTIHSITVRRGDRLWNRLEPAKIKVVQRESDLERNLYNGTLTAVMFLEDVRAGDVISYAYTLRGRNPIFAGRYSGSFSTEYSEYVRHWRLRVLIPQARSLRWAGRMTSLQPQVTETNGLRSYTWEAERLKARAPEPGAPSWVDHFASIQLSEYGSWKDLVDWALQLYRTPAEVPQSMRDMAASWMKTSDSEEERTVAAARFVQDQVRYLGVEVGENSHKPSPPEKVFRRRFGDCKEKSLLLVTFLRLMGIQAWPALVSTDLRQSLTTWLPSPTVFNHVIVQCKAGGKERWIDPTVDLQRGKLEVTAAPPFRKALPIRDGADSLADIPPNLEAAPLIEVTEKFESEDFVSPATLTVTTIYEGEAADRIRGSLASSRKDETARSYREFYAEEFPGVEQSAPLEVADNEILNVLSVTEHYRIIDFWQGRSDSLVYKVVFRARIAGSYLKRPGSSQRTLPYQVRYPAHVRQHIEARLPGFWHYSADTRTIEDGAFRFNYQLKPTTMGFTIDHEYEALAPEVPADRVGEYIRHIEDADEHIGHNFTLKRADAQAAAIPPAAAFIIGIAAVVFLVVAAVLTILAFIFHASGVRHAFSIRAIFREAGELFGRNLRVSAAATLAVLIAPFVPELCQAVTGQPASWTVVPGMLISLGAAVVLTKCSLASVDGRKLTFSEAMPSPRELLHYTAALLLAAVATVIGLVLLAVPGVFAALRLQFYGFVIVDRHRDAWTALHESFQITRRAESSLLVFFAVNSVMTVLGIATLGLGLLIIMPFGTAMQALIYDHLSRASEDQTSDDSARDNEAVLEGEEPGKNEVTSV